MIFPAWNNLNEKRHYPLLQSAAGLPLPVLVDAEFLLLPQSEFVVGEHNIWLDSVEDSSGTLIFHFKCDAPVFVRNDLGLDIALDRTSTKYTVFNGVVAADGSDPAIPCTPDLWTGAITIGDLTALDGILATDDTLTLTDNFVEQATIQSLADSYVQSITVANKDRTLSQAPPGCPLFDWSGRPSYWILGSCMVGDFTFLPGYRVRVQQSDSSNTIQLSISVRAGDPVPCGELQLSPDEVAPAWSTFLDGSIACQQTIRSIGGGSGPDLILSSRQGIAITTVAAENRVIINVNFTGLIVCPTEVEFV